MVDSNSLDIFERKMIKSFRGLDIMHVYMNNLYF